MELYDFDFRALFPYEVHRSCYRGSVNIHIRSNKCSLNYLFYYFEPYIFQPSWKLNFFHRFITPEINYAIWIVTIYFIISGTFTSYIYNFDCIDRTLGRWVVFVCAGLVNVSEQIQNLLGTGNKQTCWYVAQSLSPCKREADTETCLSVRAFNINRLVWGLSAENIFKDLTLCLKYL
jgi:hypothetical protein